MQVERSLRGLWLCKIAEENSAVYNFAAFSHSFDEKALGAESFIQRLGWSDMSMEEKNHLDRKEEG